MDASRDSESSGGAAAKTVADTAPVGADYESMPKELLVRILRRRDADQPMGLVWERQEIEHENALADHLPVAEIDEELALGEDDARNLIIEGDNFEAIKLLAMTHAGRFKCIYIDPPYNTGKKDFVYNDRFVGAHDRFRHSTWIEFLYRRLVLARRLLRPDGVIFVSIGDGEVHTLGMLMDRVFLPRNRLGMIVWRNVTDNNPTRIANEHEYILCYAADEAKQAAEWKVLANPVKDRVLEAAEALKAEHADLRDLVPAWKAWVKENKPFIWPFQRYDEIDEDGPYTGSQSVHNPGREGYRYDVLHPKTGKPCKEPLMGYRFPPDTMKDLVANDRIIFGKDENKIVELKVYAKDYRTKLPSVITLDGRLGAYELAELFPGKTKAFNNPKPTEMLAELLSFVTSGDDMVLDFFAGSGSTGHAVMKLNQEDGGNRRFVLVSHPEATDVQPNRNLCRDVLRERIGRAAKAMKVDPACAYLRVAQIGISDVLYDLDDQQAFTFACLCEDVPPPNASPSKDGTIISAAGKKLVYARRATKTLLAKLSKIPPSQAVTVYTWTPASFDGLPSHIRVAHIGQEIEHRFARLAPWQSA